MVKAGAFEESISAFWVRSTQADVEAIMLHLQGHGLVRASPEVRGATPWRFTQHGLAQIVTERALVPHGL
eukprot:10122379-Lingulodinium_polyedra.AAC.1